MKQVLAPFALFLLLAAADSSEVTVRHRPVSSAPPESWAKYCGNLSMSGTPTGGSPISAVRVPGLVLAWRTPLKGPVASAPSILGTTLYVGDWSGTETAIDTRDGSVIATADLGQTHAAQCMPQTLGVTSSPSIVNGLIYLAGGDDGFYALDAHTLKVVWKTSLGDNTNGYYGWSSPAVVGDHVLQGVASDCDDPFVQGRLVKLDRFTGKQVASADFIGEGGVGNGVWTSPTVDLENHTVFVTTASGQDYSDGLGYSIVRLDLDTLQYQDSWKVDMGDDATWDADWGSSPTLFKDRDGNQLVGAGHKDGHYYAFARNDLSFGPVWTAEIAAEGEIPQEGDGTLSTAAFDGTRVYVGGGTPPDTTDPDAHGSVVAIDPANGKVLWRQNFPGPVIAPVSTVNGVVFAVGGNLVEAIDAAEGKVLWSYRTDSLLYGGVAIVGDSIYVGDLSGKLYAFRIP